MRLNQVKQNSYKLTNFQKKKSSLENSVSLSYRKKTSKTTKTILTICRTH